MFALVKVKEKKEKCCKSSNIYIIQVKSYSLFLEWSRGGKNLILKRFKQLETH